MGVLEDRPVFKLTVECMFMKSCKNDPIDLHKKNTYEEAYHTTDFFIHQTVINWLINISQLQEMRAFQDIKDKKRKVKKIKEN